jgi:hypothetical protein
MPHQRKGPFHLVTVNTAPERATRLIGRMTDALRNDYEIIHVANCSSIQAPSWILLQLHH